jgi:hypothetical protein
MILSCFDHEIYHLEIHRFPEHLTILIDAFHQVLFTVSVFNEELLAAISAQSTHFPSLLSG